jgi:Family of unknown function (DUF5681)
MRKKVRNRRARYAVGYGRPPTSSQFQPGQSGNPQGRPKGVRNASSMARDALERTINVKVKGAWRKMTVRKAAYRRLAERAVAGDAKRSTTFYRWRAKSACPGLITRKPSHCPQRISNFCKVSLIVGEPACRSNCNLMHASSNVLTRKRTTNEKTDSVREVTNKIPLPPSKCVDYRSCSERRLPPRLRQLH